MFSTYLDISSPSVQVQMQVFDLPVLAKHILDILLGRLLVQIGDDDDPALDTTDGRCVRCRRAVATVLAGGVGRGGRRSLIDLHLRVGHNRCVRAIFTRAVREGRTGR